jgi:hypothetical protein
LLQHDEDGVLGFSGQNLLQEEEGGRDALPSMFFQMFAVPGAKHPLTSSVRLSFCTLFQPCTVLQQTMQPTFQCSSKQLEGHILLLFSGTVLGLHLAFEAEELNAGLSPQEM